MPGDWEPCPGNTIAIVNTVSVIDCLRGGALYRGSPPDSNQDDERRQKAADGSVEMRIDDDIATTGAL